MGLLNKIRNDHDTPAQKQVVTTLDSNRLDGKPTEPAAPCPSCRSPHFWRSAYGGQLRCSVCEQWPSLAMVGERWTIYTRRDGSWVWVPALRDGERARVCDENLHVEVEFGTFREAASAAGGGDATEED